MHSYLFVVLRSLSESLLRIGSIVGFFTNFYQERLYRYARLFSPTRRSVKTNPNPRQNSTKRWVEGRLYLALVAAPLFPIGMYIYALTSLSNIHWIVPIVGITVSLPRLSCSPLSHPL